MVILVTGANGQLGMEMRIVANGSADRYIFTDVNQVEGFDTEYLDITDLTAVRRFVADNKVEAIVNCAAMNIGITCLFQLWFGQSMCPVVQFLGHMVVLFLIFK